MFNLLTYRTENKYYWKELHKIKPIPTVFPVIKSVFKKIRIRSSFKGWVCVLYNAAASICESSMCLKFILNIVHDSIYNNRL